MSRSSTSRGDRWMGVLCGREDEACKTAGGAYVREHGAWGHEHGWLFSGGWNIGFLKAEAGDRLVARLLCGVERRRGSAGSFWDVKAGPAPRATAWGGPPFKGPGNEAGPHLPVGQPTGMAASGKVARAAVPSQISFRGYCEWYCLS